MSNDECRPPEGSGTQTAGEVVTPTVADHDRAHALVEGLRRATGPGQPGCPCGCATRPGRVDDPACARHTGRYSRAGVEIAVEHFRALGMLHVVEELLRDQWQAAS